MAVFTIAAGATLRMDKMLGNVPVSVAALVGLDDGTVAWRWSNYTQDPATILYDVRSTHPIFTPPESDPETDAFWVTYAMGDITLDMQFFDPAFGPGPVGTLTGTTWHDVTLYDYITYVNIGGLDPLQPVDHYYVFDFDHSVLFAGDDVVTLGGGHDVFYDYGGGLQASLGAGDDEAWLYEAFQNVQDIKFVDAGDGDDKVYFQSGNGTILGGAGDDLISGAGNSDGTWLFNGGAGRDRIDAVNASRIEDDKGSGNDHYTGYLSPNGYRGVLSYAGGDGGIVVDLNNAAVRGGGHGLDFIEGFTAVEGTQGDDRFLSAGLNDNMGGVWGLRFWGMGGDDTMEGAGGKDLLDGGDGADLITAGLGKDRVIGGGGDDSLAGGAGADRMNGGLGADDFVYTTAGDSKAPLAKADRITGFEVGVDDIDLSRLGGLQFNGTAPATGRGQIWIEQGASSTSVLINLGRTLAPDMRIVLDGLHTLTVDDFIL